MIDREKVIKGLECCRNLSPVDVWKCPEECPYSIESAPFRCCTFNPLLDDAIAILREREPVKPIEVNETVKIIQHGNYYNKWLRFECDCGCVFETTQFVIERFGIERYGNDFCYASCPECKNDVTIPMSEDEKAKCQYLHPGGGDNEYKCWGQKGAPVCYCGGDTAKCEILTRKGGRL